MGTVSLYKKRARLANWASQSFYWGSWGSVSGENILGSAYGLHSVYHAQVDMTGSSSLNSVSFNSVIACTGNKYATIRAYLYTSDPTTGSPSSPPSGYISYDYDTRLLTSYGANITFSFTGLGLTNAANLYIWVTAEYDAQDGVFVSSYDNMDVYSPRSISGSFSAAASMTLSISPAYPTPVTTAASGNYVNLTIANGGSGALYADFYYGSSQTAFKSVRVYNGLNQIPVTAAWFDLAGVTQLRSMTVTVKIRGGSTTPTDSLVVQAGNDAKPTVGTPTATIQQGASAAQDYPNTYIANISKVKVSVDVDVNTNAAIATNGVVLTYPGGTRVVMQYNSNTGKYEGTTAAPITQNTTFTVTATDVRGMSTQKTVQVTGVVAYTPPSVVVNVAYRCNSVGVEESGGVYFKIKVTANYNTNLSGNSLKKLTAGVKNGTANNLTSGTLCGPFSGTTNPKSAYVIEIIVQDKVSGEIPKEITLEGMSRNIVVTRSNDGTYVGFGTTPTRTSGPSAVELPGDGGVLLGGNNYGAFEHLFDETDNVWNSSFGSDFLNVDFQNRFAAKNATALFSNFVGNISNTPSAIASTSIFAGLRKVMLVTQSTAFVLLFELTPSPGRVWINTYYSNAWQGWKYFYTVSVS